LLRSCEMLREEPAELDARAFGHLDHAPRPAALGGSLVATPSAVSVAAAAIAATPPLLETR
jgi:hypothetical protein